MAATYEKETQMAKREIVDTGTNKRYVRRDGRGRFTKDQRDVGRSLTQDRRKQAHTKAPKGQAIAATANRHQYDPSRRRGRANAIVDVHAGPGYGIADVH